MQQLLSDAEYAAIVLSQRLSVSIEWLLNLPLKKLVQYLKWNGENGY